MTAAPATPHETFNLVCVAQAGRLSCEAVLFAASLRAADPGFAGRLLMAEPQPGALWPADPRIPPPERDLLENLGAEILPFESRHFGAAYPQGNKIECLAEVPDDRPFVFFDTDTLFTGPVSAMAFDFDRPSASMRREGTWPRAGLYGPEIGEIWRALHERLGLDFESSLDPAHPTDSWRRYLYFNAGWFFHRSARSFGRRWLEIALDLRDGEIAELASQSLDPWLDQASLPLAIHALGGGRPGPALAGLDGDATCHYRALPLLYARESDPVVAMLEEVAAPNRVKKVLKAHEPMKRLVYQRKGQEIRAMFDRTRLPVREQTIRQRLKAAGLWLR